MVYTGQYLPEHVLNSVDRNSFEYDQCAISFHSDNNKPLLARGGAKQSRACFYEYYNGIQKYEQYTIKVGEQYMKARGEGVSKW